MQGASRILGRYRSRRSKSYLAGGTAAASEAGLRHAGLIADGQGAHPDGKAAGAAARFQGNACCGHYGESRWDVNTKPRAQETPSRASGETMTRHPMPGPGQRGKHQAAPSSDACPAMDRRPPDRPALASTIGAVQRGVPGGQGDEGNTQRGVGLEGFFPAKSCGGKQHKTCSQGAFYHAAQLLARDGWAWCRGGVGRGMNPGVRGRASFRGRVRPELSA